MIEEERQNLWKGQPQRICPIHKQKIVAICRSPLCDHYQQLCSECQTQHPHPDFVPWSQAVEQAKQLLNTCLKHLELTRLRKNADMDTYLRNNMVLLQIQSRLTQIKELINQKIQDFKQSVNRIYFQHVKQKLQDLDDIISKSEATLKHEIKILKQKPQLSLSKYYTRDLLHEVKYYDSYFNQIFIKKTRNFRTALQNDRILTLVVTFQQNLKKIFTFNPEKIKNDNRQFHLFRQQTPNTVLYTLSKDTAKIQRKQLPDISTLVNFPEKYEYKWDGIPQSVFYPPSNCYYIIGQGKKTSKQIIKWEQSKPIDDSFFAVRSMETQRRYFSVCELGGQIYIIGGQNDKDGCLARCEKFVPAYSSQIYIIHSLNTRSSRHSLTTFKNKYILKFGGVRKLLDNHRLSPQIPKNSKRISAPPQIYSTQTEEWSVIPVSLDIEIQLGCNPSIFKSQNKSLLSILGGQQYSQQKTMISIFFEDSKTAEQQLKIKKHRNTTKLKGQIHNSTICIDQEEYNATFLSSLEPQGEIFLLKMKLQS